MADNSISAQLSEAGAALSAFARGPAQEAADAMAGAFEKSGERIARALGQAAISGEDSFRKLAKTILEELAKIAINQFLPGMSAPSAGASLFSAPVASGNAPMTVNFNLGAGADAESIRRNQSQIAAQVARAAAYGSRNL